MATVSELVVLVTANTSQFQSGMAKAEASTSKFATAAKVGLAIAAVAAVKFVADSVQAYEEHQKVLLELQTTISNSPALIGASTAAFEEQATALQNLTGFQDEEVIKADAVLGRFGLTADQLTAVNPLVLDYARATGQDAATAAGALGKALLGNTRALKAIGINFTATGKTGQDFNTILGLLENRVGGLSEAYGKTLAGQLAIAEAKFDDVKETVGKALIPILSKLADVANVTLIPALQTIADHIDVVLLAATGFLAWKLYPTIIGAVSSAVAALTVVVDSLNVSLIGAATSLGTVAKVLPLAGLGFGGYKEDVFQGNKVIEDFAAGVDGASGALGRSTMTAQQAAAVQQELNNQLIETTGSLRDQLDAALALADSTFGLISATRDNQTAEQALAAAHRKVTQLEEAGKTGTQAYAEARRTLRDAAFDAAKSELDLAGAARRLQQDIASGKTDRETAIANIRDLGREAGLTGKDIQGLVDDVKKGLHDASTTASKLAPGIGIAISEGIKNGIDQRAGAIAQSAEQAVLRALAAARQAADAHSPSRKMFKLGEDMVQGLIEGMVAHQGAAVDAAKAVLQKVLDAASSFKDAIAGGFSGFGELSGAFGTPEAPPTPESIDSFVSQQVGAASQFASILKALKSRGASKGLLTQIASGGAEAVPFAQALLQGGPTLIKDVSDSLNTIAGLASDTSEHLTKSFFGQKIDALKDQVVQEKNILGRLADDLRFAQNNPKVVININGDVTGEEVVNKVEKALESRLQRQGAILNGAVRT